MMERKSIDLQILKYSGINAMILFFKHSLRKQVGFTLVEMLIAVAISGLIVAALSGTILQLFKNTQSNSNEMTAIRNLDSAGSWFVRDFGAVSGYPGGIILSPGVNELEIKQSIFAKNDTTILYSIDTDGNLKRQNNSITSTIGTNIMSIEYIPGIDNEPIQLNLTSKVGLNQVSRSVQIKTRIVELDLFMVTTHLPSATVGAEYFQQVIATGGIEPLTWSISGGYLPDGLSIDPLTGIISGEPTSYDSFTFTVLVQDSDSPQDSVDRTFIISVVDELNITTASPLPAGNQEVLYTEELLATGGTEPYTWSILSGSLPPGLGLDPPSSRFLTGTPTSSGSYDFKVQVIDADGTIKQKDLTLTINMLPPEVRTDPATSIGKTSATLNGYLTSLGSETSVTLYFEWGTDTSYSGGSVQATNPAQTMSSTGSFFATTGAIFQNNKTYHFRVKGIGNDGIVVYGNDQQFKTKNN
jgi:prepilin-type N-terminal cleavage/methylation domain-containing protein